MDNAPAWIAGNAFERRHIAVFLPRDAMLSAVCRRRVSDCPSVRCVCVCVCVSLSGSLLFQNG